jgi:hypothetical protein
MGEKKQKDIHAKAFLKSGGGRMQTQRDKKKIKHIKENENKENHSISFCSDPR